MLKKYFSFIVISLLVASCHDDDSKLSINREATLKGTIDLSVDSVSLKDFSSSLPDIKICIGLKTSVSNTGRMFVSAVEEHPYVYDVHFQLEEMYFPIDGKINIDIDKSLFGGDYEEIMEESMGSLSNLSIDIKDIIPVIDKIPFIGYPVASDKTFQLPRNKDLRIKTEKNGKFNQGIDIDFYSILTALSEILKLAKLEDLSSKIDEFLNTDRTIELESVFVNTSGIIDIDTLGISFNMGGKLGINLPSETPETPKKIIINIKSLCVLVDSK